jgi:formylglycine-generating enzyme required for sulfatase activity
MLWRVRRSLLVIFLSVPASAEKVSTGQMTSMVKHESEMVYVGGGDFHYGLTNAELDTFHDACRDLYGDLGAQFCPVLGGDAAQPAEKVWVSSFFMDRFEVTAGQFRACVDAGACSDTALVTGDTRFAIDDWPMVNVTWNDAQTYCHWRGKRLPTEAEWEKAARGEDGRVFPWGGENALRLNHGTIVIEGMWPLFGDLADGDTDDSDGTRYLAPPGSYPNGRSPYGAYDMAGNVSEWVADWWADRYGKETVDPTGPQTGDQRVFRGGNFHEPTLWSRTYLRQHVQPFFRFMGLGFRCAADVKR